MLNKILSAAFMFLVIIGVLWVGSQLKLKAKQGTDLEHITACGRTGGQWQEKYKECVGDVRDMCQTYGGKWNDCASSCRHNTPGVFCLTQCVPLCAF